jgi:hypothetical protein
MSNTLKFGDGKWAVKEGSTLAYNDENGNFKPLPFEFNRSTSATRVNKQGLIEVVSNNEPRIDFSNDSKGALLLEPSRTNYVQNSELTNTWTYTEFGSGSAGTITTGKTDMFGGTNAVQIDFPSNAENVSIRFGTTVSALTSGSATLSLYIKLVESGSKDLQLRASFSGIVNVNSTEFTRVDLSGTKNSSELFNLKLRPSEGTSNGGFSIIICHPQEEQGSYATSYIPTQGAIVTRVADSCEQTLPSGIIGQTEGTIFFNADLTNTFGVQLGNSSGSNDYVNSIQIAFGSVSTNVNVFNGGVNQLSYSGVVNTGVKKVAFTYKQNDFALYIDGNQIMTDNLGTIPSISGIFFNHQNLDTTGGLLTDLKLYNTRLSNAELAALTKI